MLRFLPKKGAQPVLSTALPGFDEVYYRYWYRDVESFGGGPLAHYLQIGWREGRDPSAGFSTDGYLSGNPDVMAGGHNPLVHFLNVGLSEGRKGWEKDPSAPPPRPLPPGHLKPRLLLSPPSI
jgi:hypothetical protein